MKISDIKIGPRHRKELGDLAGLAASIQARGLLQPVVVDESGNLIAGFRRLKACEKLGWADVPVRVVNPDDPLLAERDENTQRLPFTPTELVAIGKEIELREAAKAKERSAANLRRGNRPPTELPPGENTAIAAFSKKPPISGKFPDRDPGPTRARDVVGERLGVNGRTYERMKEVTEAAESEPDVFGDLAEHMDTTGEVRPAHDELKRRQRGEQPQPVAVTRREPPPQREIKRAPNPLSKHLNEIADKLGQMITGTHLTGGIAAYAEQMSPEERQHLADALRAIVKDLRTWIALLEKPNAA